MTISEFEALIAAYGANSARWPENRRVAGERFLKTNPDAQKLLQAETKLDAMLDTISTSEPSEILKARIMKAATGQVHSAPLENTPRRQYWKIAASFAVIVAVGAIGYSTYTSPSEIQTEETVWLEAANELGVSDIYTWVEGTE